MERDLHGFVSCKQELDGRFRTALGWFDASNNEPVYGSCGETAYRTHRRPLGHKVWPEPPEAAPRHSCDGRANEHRDNKVRQWPAPARLTEGDLPDCYYQACDDACNGRPKEEKKGKQV